MGMARVVAGSLAPADPSGHFAVAALAPDAPKTLRQPRRGRIFIVPTAPEDSVAPLGAECRGEDFALNGAKAEVANSAQRF